MLCGMVDCTRLYIIHRYIIMIFCRGMLYYYSSVISYAYNLYIPIILVGFKRDS